MKTYIGGDCHQHHCASLNARASGYGHSGSLLYNAIPNHPQKKQDIHTNHSCASIPGDQDEMWLITVHTRPAHLETDDQVSPDVEL